MRRYALALLVIVAACSSKTGAGNDGKTVRVAAASDLARAFGDVGKEFEKQSGIKLVFDFGSSGLLAKQIEQGAPFQLYAAANRAFAEQVVKAGKCDAASLALYSRGRVVLWSKSGQIGKL